MFLPELTIPELYSQLGTCKKNCITFRTNWNTAVQKLQRTLTGSTEYGQLLHSIGLYKNLLQEEYEKMNRLIGLVNDINAKELNIISRWISETEKPLPLNKPLPKSKSPYHPSPIRIKVNPRPEVQLGPEAKKSKKEEKKEESDSFEDDWPGDKLNEAPSKQTIPTATSIETPTAPTTPKTEDKIVDEIFAATDDEKVVTENDKNSNNAIL